MVHACVAMLFILQFDAGWHAQAPRRHAHRRTRGHAGAALGHAAHGSLQHAYPRLRRVKACYPPTAAKRVKKNSWLSICLARYQWNNWMLRVWVGDVRPTLPNDQQRRHWAGPHRSYRPRGSDNLQRRVTRCTNLPATVEALFSCSVFSALHAMDQQAAGLVTSRACPRSARWFERRQGAGRVGSGKRGVAPV